MEIKRPGQVVVLRFPQTDLNPGKLRPALLMAPLPGPYDDWLACMVSTQLHQAVRGFDEVIDRNSSDFALSGLKVPSLIRVARLAVVSREVLVGSLGEISSERLQRIRKNLSSWIAGSSSQAK